MAPLLKVNLVVNSFPTASESFLFNLVTGLEQKGVDVAVLTAIPSTDAYLYKERMDEWSGKIIYYGSNSVKYIFRYIKALVKNYTLFFQLLSKYGCRKAIYYTSIFDVLTFNSPDIIHFSFSGIAVQYLPIIKELNKKAKTIVSCRGTAEKVKPILEKERSYQLNNMFGVVHRVHCVSKDMMMGLLPMGLSEQKAFVNYPSIDVLKFKRTIPLDFQKLDKWNIVTTGSLIFQKGYIFALQAMRYLKDQGFNFTYHILGEGPERSMLMYVIHEFKLQNEVILHGKVSSSEVLEQLNKADVFLLSSLSEGVANAALEAMSMEIPIVTTNAGGMKEVVINKENGMIVERFSGIALAEAIEVLLEDKKLRQKVAQNARKTIMESFTSERQIECFIKEYQSSVNN